jgi:hypothetical protein
VGGERRGWGGGWGGGVGKSRFERAVTVTLTFFPSRCKRGCDSVAGRGAPWVFLFTPRPTAVWAVPCILAHPPPPLPQVSPRIEHSGSAWGQALNSENVVCFKRTVLTGVFGFVVSAACAHARGAFLFRKGVAPKCSVWWMAFVRRGSPSFYAPQSVTPLPRAPLVLLWVSPASPAPPPTKAPCASPCTAPSLPTKMPDMETGFEFRKQTYQRLGLTLPMDPPKRVLLLFRDTARRNIVSVGAWVGPAWRLCGGGQGRWGGGGNREEVCDAAGGAWAMSPQPVPQVATVCLAIAGERRPANTHCGVIQSVVYVSGCS